MKKQIFSKLVLLSALSLATFGCQCNRPDKPSVPPVAPPQAYDSGSCTDPDECSEGASIEVISEEPAAPAATTEAVAPAEEKVSVEPAAPTAAVEKTETAPEQSVSSTPAPEAAAEPAETAAVSLVEIHDQI